MRHAHRTDANQAAIVAALRKVGATVIDTSGLPGFVDLVVGWRKTTILYEIKRPAGPRGGKSGRQLTPDQRRLHDQWTGGTLVTVDSPQAALSALGVV